MSETDPLADVVEFLRLPEFYPQLFAAKHSAAWLLRQRDRNGLDAIVRWIGRTAYVSKADFAAWFRERSEPPSATPAQRAASARNIRAARSARQG